LAFIGLSADTALARTIGPDANGYSATDSPTGVSFIDISSTGTVLPNSSANDDSFDGPIPIGFSFPFYGTAQTQCYVSSNGLITFGAGNSQLDGNLTSGMNNPTIAVWLDDLYPGNTTGVRYQTVGSAPNRTLVVQWSSRTHYSVRGGEITFQAQLRETSGAIAMIYPDTVFGNVSIDNGQSATVGISDAAGNTNGRVLQWSFVSPVITSGTKLLFTRSFTTSASLTTARYAHSSTLLPNGKVLVVGGNNSSDSPIASAELYDPASGTWSATSPLSSSRAFHTATLLPNGKVLVAGGYNGSYLASAELYDPATGTWTSTGSLATARAYHTTTLLPNGKVIISAGFNGGAIASAELYDPASGTWTATGPLANARRLHTATLLANGKLLVAGGAVTGANGIASAELYDPATGTWTATGPLAAARLEHSATLLPNGKLLVAGGYNSGIFLTSAELYDPATGTWAATGSLATARTTHTATLLPNGKMLVTGGYGNSNYLTSAEIYDPANGTWTITGSLAIARRFQTATVLPNGKVLVAAGYNLGALASTQFYDFASGSWSSTNRLATTRSHQTATLLPNGKLLVAGGSNSGYLASAELYDSATGTWVATGSLAFARNQHTATWLPNGKLIVVAGYNSATGPLASAELYDPASGTWTTTGSLVVARSNHTATLLPNSKLLVTGGNIDGVSAISSAELYDPVTGIWTATSRLATTRSHHTATLLPNGKLLVAGGSNSGYLASAELYDSSTGAWVATGSLATARNQHTATLLPNGKLIVVAGYNSTTGPLASAELYDPATGTWTTTGSLVAARINHTATLLPNGKLLVAGGNIAGPSAISSAELYDPATGTWTATGPLATARSHQTVTLLPNGKLLVAGGNVDGVNAISSAELYDVGLGFSNSTQPVISSATINGAGKLVLVGTGFSGISGASGGNGVQDSATNYPVVQIRRLDNDQCTFVLPDPATNTSATSFTSLPIAPFSGYAMVTVFTNGIPSAGTLISYQQTLAVVTGPVASSITDISAVLGGTISSDGGASITARGIVYAVTATNPNPALGGVGVTNLPKGGTTGSFSNDATSLVAGTPYSFRVYATNSAGTSYSNVGNFTTLFPDITLAQPVGTSLASGGTRDFGTTVVGTPLSLTFTISNPGNANLSGLTVTKNGADAGDFNVTALPVAPVLPRGSTTFAVQFSPTGGITGIRNAALQIANNVTGKNPYIINLTGQMLSLISDTDGDGLNDASEFKMTPLGFNWQVAQTSLVSNYYSNANGAGLYTTSQVHALNVGTPLIHRNPTTGQFKLTLDLEKSTNLTTFTPFPFTAPQTTVNGQGKLEFLFTSPDDAVFFRLGAE
jgi:uncharacterized delta-60 repeat protein